jgi:hypothetical protein
VSYWVDFSLGQGEFPGYKIYLSKKCKVDEVVGVKTQWEWGS